MSRPRSEAKKYRPGPVMFRIAVIEDDRVIRQLLDRTLVQNGFECLLAPDAASGLKMCAEGKPDLALIDVLLPDGNGIDLCRQMKADGKLRNIPVLIMTGRSQAVEDRIAGIEAGADDYLIKPFQIPELVSRIRGVLKASVKPTKP